MREQDGVNKCTELLSVRPLGDHGFPVFSFITADGATKMFHFTQRVGLYWATLRACFSMQITCLFRHPELLISVVDKTKKPVNLPCCSLKLLLAIRTKLFRLS
jgi:hypothetical protein